MSLRILLADDHQIIRDGLRALLEQEPDLEVVGEAEDGRTAVQRARELSPDVVVMDLTMPDMNGIEATRQMQAQVPQAKVLILSMHADRRFVGRVLEAGAAGYLLKDCAFEQLAQAIRTVTTNQTYLCPTVADILRQDYLRFLSETDSSMAQILTPREREVLQLVAEGKATRNIAAYLHVSVKTVEKHRQQIMEKLNLHSVAELTKYAIREGITSLEP